MKASNSRPATHTSNRAKASSSEQGARIVLKAQGFGQKPRSFFARVLQSLVLLCSTLLSLALLSPWLAAQPTLDDRAHDPKTMSDDASKAGDEPAAADRANAATKDTDQGMSEPPPRVGLIAEQTERDLAQSLANSDPLTQTNWLTVAEQDYLALFKPAAKPSPRGVVIVLPDRRQHPDWPQYVRPLRNGLAERGWITWALSLPYAPQPPPPARPADPAPMLNDETGETKPGDGETKNEENPAPKPMPAPEAMMDPETMMAPEQMTNTTEKPPIDEQIDALQRQALAQIGNIANGNLVIIGVGEGGFWASRWAQQLQASRQDLRIKLVFIDIDNQVIGLDAGFAEFLPEPMPVLDLYPANSGPDAKLRKRLSKAAGFRRYIQQDLPQQALSNSRLINRVHGFAKN